LPRKAGDRALRHVLEVRHESFLVPAFVELLRDQNVAVVYADSEDYPAIADVTGEIVYARLQRAEETQPTGYAPKDLDAWAKRARTWEKGATPDDLPAIEKPADSKSKRDVFVYMINGHKPHAPAAAMALIERLAKAR
jgi:uncharacterized protein YecE (DUF72 family)